VPVEEAPSRLARRLGTGDAVVVGLGSMIGAGVFAAFGPAAAAAGNGLVLALAIAAVVAYCNATSSAALYPERPKDLADLALLDEVTTPGRRPAGARRARARRPAE